jgi:hypothetical protein
MGLRTKNHSQAEISVKVLLLLLILASQLDANTPFVRGDVNGDTQVTFDDVDAIVAWLFLGGAIAVPNCLVAIDVNDDKYLDLSDAVFLSYYLNAMGPPPPAPFPVCGLADGNQQFECEIHTACD